MSTRSTGTRTPRRMIDAAFILGAICFALVVQAADKAAPDATPAIDADAFFAAIVKIEARALPDARSTATLGTEREGTGVVIAKDGLVLTIGYLLIEADDVKIVDSRGHTLPARIVAYDHVTGLGLVRPITPLDVTPLKLGDSSKLAEADPVLIVNNGGRSDATRAYVVSRRQFSGSWEYLLDSAIFTSPPTLNWSGAALIGTDGSLLGIGSLILRDATDTDSHLPGNMFVPIEAVEADSRRSDQVGSPRRARSPVAGCRCRRGAGPTRRRPRVTGGTGRCRRYTARRHHPGRRWRGGPFASRLLSQAVGARGGG